MKPRTGFLLSIALALLGLILVAVALGWAQTAEAQTLTGREVLNLPEAAQHGFVRGVIDAHGVMCTLPVRKGTMLY
jgi:hypothetical protein